MIQWTQTRYPGNDPENGMARRNPVDGCSRCFDTEAEAYNANGVCLDCQEQLQDGLRLDDALRATLTPCHCGQRPENGEQVAHAAEILDAESGCAVGWCEFGHVYVRDMGVIRELYTFDDHSHEE